LNEQLQAAVSTGTAAELLAKAYLCSISAPLIADKGDKDTVLLLSGRRDMANAEPLTMKTLSAFDLLRLTKQLRQSSCA
jgi:hypothetical protein